MSWPNGMKYNGCWKDDSYDGKGVFSWSNGEILDGYWKDNK